MAFKIVFLGSPPFAATSLSRLLETGATVAGVVTAPDRPKGRTLKLRPTAVRELADKAGLPVITPEDFHAPEVLCTLRAWAPNVIVVVAFGQILKEAILELPPLGCINVHPSLLPRYRGAAPIQRAIMQGEVQTGVAIAKMVRKLDSGDLLLCQPVGIGPDETYGSLHDRLADCGADLLVEALKALASGTAKSVAQDDKLANYAQKIQPHEERIVWDSPSARIRNLIRAMNPAPGARSMLSRGGKQEMVKIWSAHEASAADLLHNGCQGPVVVGTVLDVHSDGMRVATGDGSIWIDEVQTVSKPRMTMAQWLMGHRVQRGDVLYHADA